MTDCSEAMLLHSLGEHFAAGYVEMPQGSPLARWSRAVRRRWEAQPVPIYRGQLLWPDGPVRAIEQNSIVQPSYSFTYTYHDTVLEARLRSADPATRCALCNLRQEMRALDERLDCIHTPHTVGGRGYTHSIPNYGRVLREGLDAHAQQVEDGLERAITDKDADGREFFEAITDVIEGIRAWHQQLLDHLRALTPLSRQGQALLAALERVPWRPARSFFEALVAYNLVFYLDDCDNPGCIDQELSPYLQTDLSSGRVDHEQAVALVRAFWRHVDDNDGWSAVVGGTRPDGAPHYGEMTVICLQAARGMRRPNLQLHVRPEMPAVVWEAASDTLESGTGLPALYHDAAFIEGLRAVGLRVVDADIGLFSGGGCTETMIHGCSNVGSLDAGINLPLILSQTLETHLPTATRFEDIASAYEAAVEEVVAETVSQVNADQAAKAAWRPQPMRTLLIDDCLDRGIEYNAGGARYNWSVINVAGLANVIDSLAALRQVVFERREQSGAAILDQLRTNWPDEALRQRMTQCPQYGNDQPLVDALAERVGRNIFTALSRHKPWRGGRYVASCLMFVTYGEAGRHVMATPDGRRAGEPLADSAGPYQGRDTHGPTAMLHSVAKLPQGMAPGTLCVNMRLSRSFFASDARSKLRDLILGYFALGGMQLQINVVDQVVLEEAIAHPERHRDLVVRVGGYSEYFCRLTPQLQHTILERVEHGID